jgi:hypothetical protein
MSHIRTPKSSDNLLLGRLYCESLEGFLIPRDITDVANSKLHYIAVDQLYT